jgi:uncharacterized protein YecE (DUF72 family)
VPLLRTFLDSLPPGALTAWEFRHESWFADETYEALADYDAALCLAENEKMDTPQVMTASFAYYRFRNPSYSPERLKEIASELAGFAKNREVYASFKHEEDPQSASWSANVLKVAQEQMGHLSQR